jgi:cytochrome c oxidase cbb3-type subunit 4
VTSLQEYFKTDWAAMTSSDWVGTILTVVTFVLMVVVYAYVLRPKTWKRLEKFKNIPLDDERIDSGEKNDG